MSIVCHLLDFTDEQIDRLLKDPQSFEEVLEEDEEFIVYLDKAWHGIHYLLTGVASGGEEPLCYLMSGGIVIYDALDMRGLKSNQITEFDKALCNISEQDFRARYDPRDLISAGIYGHSNRSESSGEIDYLLHHFEP